MTIASKLAAPDLAVEAVRSTADLAQIRERGGDRVAFERQLSQTMAERESWTLPGFCQVCERAVAFTGDWRFSNGRMANFRERLVCPGCNLNNRKRFIAQALRSASREASQATPTYLFEQVTPFFGWAHQALPGEVTGSEYLGPDLAGGTTVDGVRHEDALSLSFDDEAFGTVVSCDVFEHVPDIDGCLSECARVLRPGGRMYFSIPFFDMPETTQRAALHDGELVELMPPHYHWNPVDPQGSLVFYDYGWDILERCRGAGFEDAYALGYWSALYGYLGDGVQLLLVAEMAP